MWIKDNEIILQRPSVGKYPTQEEVEELKNVYDLDENGFPTGDIIYTKDTISITWEIPDINWFAGQHIEKYYPLWKQSNITQVGGTELAKMTTFINAVRAWSNTDPLPNPWDGTLEAITP